MTFQQVEGEHRMVEPETGWQLVKVDTVDLRQPIYRLVLRLGGSNQVIFNAARRRDVAGFDVAWRVYFVSVVGNACGDHDDVVALLKRVMTDVGYEINSIFNPPTSVHVEVEEDF